MPFLSSSQQFQSTEGTVSLMQTKSSSSTGSSVD